MTATGSIVRAVLLFVGAALLTSISPGQQKTADVVVGSTYSFASKNIRGTIDISVHLPEGYQTSGAKYPVLYLLDIERDFVFGSAVADFLSSNERIPPLIVVGVFLGNVSGAPPQAIAFLEDELFPFIASSYRVQPCRVLYGHSGRSFAALYIFLNRPDLFYGTICAGLGLTRSPTLSPALKGGTHGSPEYCKAGDEKRGSGLTPNKPRHSCRGVEGLTSPPWTTAVDFVKLADAKLSAPGTWNKSLFFALGDEQPFLPGVAKFRDVLAAKAPPGLDWKNETMPEDDHFSNKLKTLYNGLEHVFRGFYPPAEAAAAGPEALKAHYERLSARFGYPVGLPREPIHRAVLNWLSYQNKVDLALALARGLKKEPGLEGVFEKGDLLFAGNTGVNSSRFEDAVKIYSYLCAEEPANPAGFNGLGEAYEKSGQPSLALPNYEQAVRLAQTANDPALKRYRENLERLKKG